MTQWLRLWHGTATDPKWRTIARRSGQPIPSVIAVFVLLLENASANGNERGRTQGWDNEVAADALGLEIDAIEAIMGAMQGRVLDGDYLTGWEKRQPKREDGSAERAKAWRERKRTHRNAPDTDTEQIQKESSPSPPVGGECEGLEVPEFLDRRPRKPKPERFDEFWEAYPRKVGRDAAERKYRARVKAGIPEEALIDGVRTLNAEIAEKGTEERFIPHPATWLHQGRWQDQHGPPEGEAGEGAVAKWMRLVEADSGEDACDPERVAGPAGGDLRGPGESAQGAGGNGGGLRQAEDRAEREPPAGNGVLAARIAHAIRRIP